MWNGIVIVGVDTVREVVIGFVADVTTYGLREAVDERGSLDVGVHQVVQGVLFGKLAVHRHHGSFHDDVGVAKVRYNLVDAAVRGRQTKTNTAGKWRRSAYRH